MKKILVAGATGYLGLHLLQELHRQQYSCRAIVRNPEKIKIKKIPVTEIVTAELTAPDSIKNCCNDIDVVISTVGITRQKDGLTYMDVDFRANMNLLEEAKKCNVSKFIYVSVLNGENLKHLKICQAKEKFVEKLKMSGLDYCVIRPNGFFSDMAEIFHMARKGRVYLFGNGEFKANPIHGEDLAKICINAIKTAEKRIEIGGPQTLSQKEIASIAFDVLGKKPKITCIPDAMRVLLMHILKLFTSSKVYGPVEFFLTVMAMDMLAPEYGEHTLEQYFNVLKMSPNNSI